jgi:transcription antitermination factor NusG
VVKDAEINLINKFLGEQAQLTLQPIETFKPNTCVKINQGVFMDNIGLVLKSNNKKVYVQLKSLGKVMVVQFPANHLIHESN